MVDCHVCKSRSVTSSVVNDVAVELLMGNGSMNTSGMNILTSTPTSRIETDNSTHATRFSTKLKVISYSVSSSSTSGTGTLGWCRLDPSRRAAKQTKNIFFYRYRPILYSDIHGQTDRHGLHMG